MSIAVRVTAAFNKMRSRVHTLDIRILVFSLRVLPIFRKNLLIWAMVPVNVINKSSEYSQIAMFTCITVIRVISQIKDQMNEALSKKCDGKNI